MITSILTNWRDRYYHPNVVLSTLALLFLELLFSLGFLSIALWGYLVALVVLVSVSRLANLPERIFIVLALLPLFRLVNWGMPTFTTNTIYQMLLVYSVFLPGVYLLSRRSPGENNRADRTVLVVYSVAAVALGAVLAGIELTVTTAKMSIANSPLIEGIVASVAVFIFVAIVEELLFRGVIQPELQSQIGQTGGIGLTALLFGMMHANTLSIPMILYGIGLGIILGYMYDRTSSLVIVCLLHGSLSVFLYIVFPLSDVSIT